LYFLILTPNPLIVTGNSSAPTTGKIVWLHPAGCTLKFTMAGADGVPLANVLTYAVVVIAPSAACWLFLHAPKVVARVARRIRPAAPCPSGRPIQVVAADLRRVHRMLDELEPGTPMIRRLGARRAYDALLIQACAAMDVEQHLDELPEEGMDRDIERLRVEETLLSAGMVIH
jgi:hypothetical protein